MRRPRALGASRSEPIRVSMVSGVVIFAGTSGEYFGGVAREPTSGCALLNPGAAIEATITAIKAIPLTFAAAEPIESPPTCEVAS